jgi:hypothetical protein
MTQKDFVTSMLVDKSPAEIFNAINNVRGWWQGEIAGNTNKPGDEFTYQVATIHFSKQNLPSHIMAWFRPLNVMEIVQMLGSY